MTAPNLAPSGVIQNPGIGGILGGGLSNLAQFLMQQHEQQQQAAVQQQQLGLQQQQVQQQVAESQQRMAASQQQQKQAAEEVLRHAAIVGNVKDYLTPDDSGTVPAAKDFSPAQVASYQRAYSIDPQGTSDHLMQLMSAPPIKLAKDESLVSPVTMQPLATNVAPPDVGTDFTAHQQGLGFGNIPLKDLTAPQNAAILAAMQKTRAAGAQKTVVQLGQNAMAGAMGPLMAKNIETRYNDANNAARDIGISTQALALLAKGPVGAGPLLGAQQSLSAALSSMGFDPDPKSVNTSRVIAALASRVIPLARQMTQGGGTASAGRLMSNEVELAKLAAGNLKDSSPQAIKNLLEDAVRLNTQSIAQYQTWLKSQNVDQYVPGASGNLLVNPTDYMAPPPDSPTTPKPGDSAKTSAYKGWGVGP